MAHQSNNSLEEIIWLDWVYVGMLILFSQLCHIVFLLSKYSFTISKPLYSELECKAEEMTIFLVEHYAFETCTASFEQNADNCLIIQKKSLK